MGKTIPSITVDMPNLLRRIRRRAPDDLQKSSRSVLVPESDGQPEHLLRLFPFVDLLKVTSPII